MHYYTHDEIMEAKRMDLLTYLRASAPQELVHVGGATYCTREHDSLKISNGKWHWFSRGIGGRSALDYLIKVKGHSFLEAVELILGHGALRRQTPAAARPEPDRELQLPQANEDMDTALNYLMGRGIHPVLLDYCMKHRLLYESARYHNAVFVGYDRAGKARYAALRSTGSSFKGEAPGSDKRYAFSISEYPDAERLHVFESAIDLLSFGTIALLEGHVWNRDHLLSLAGICPAKRGSAVPAALARFLQETPKIRTVCLHLDNDAPGRSAARAIRMELEGGWEVLDQPPESGKDYNDQLRKRVGLDKIMEEPER